MLETRIKIWAKRKTFVEFNERYRYISLGCMGRFLDVTSIFDER
jgi:hypothetical protein